MHTECTWHLIWAGSARCGLRARALPRSADCRRWLLDHRWWLLHAARRYPWSPDTHLLFPPAFRAAARALLLAARRNRGLGCLPQGVLHSVLLLAAYPLSAWKPRMPEEY